VNILYFGERKNLCIHLYLKEYNYAYTDVAVAKENQYRASRQKSNK